MRKTTTMVLVEWLDSLQPVVGWHMIDDLPELEAAKCKTTGWLVAENQDALMIAQNIADPGSTQMQAGGLMRIPKCCVTSLSALSSRLERAGMPQGALPPQGLASFGRKGLSKPMWIGWAMFVFLAFGVLGLRRAVFSRTGTTKAAASFNEVIL